MRISRSHFIFTMLVAAAVIGCQRPPAPSPSASAPPSAPLATPSASATPAAVAAGPHPQADASGIYRVGGEVTEPVELSRVQAQIPELYRNVQITQPLYIFEAVITVSGGVERLRLLRGRTDKEPYIAYERAFREAISQWRYRPATLHGKPVPVWLTVTATVEVR